MKTAGKAALFTIAALVTLVALFYAEENWRGRRAWESWLRDRAARGDSPDWRSIVPAPVPDGRNMAAAPVFMELFADTNGFSSQARLARIELPPARSSAPEGGWRAGRPTDVALWRVAYSNDNLAAALAPYDALVAEVRAAAARPECRFPVRYEDGFKAQLPHVSGLLKMGKLLHRRAAAAMEAGQAAAAMEDLRLMFRLAESLKTEPTLIGLLIRTALLNLALQVTWDGMAENRFNEVQLAELQSLLRRPDLIAHLALGLQGERRFAVSLLPDLIADPGMLLRTSIVAPDDGRPLWAAAIPTGWFHMNLLTVDRFYVERILPTVDAKAGTVDAARLQKASDEGFRRSPFTVVASLVLPAIANAALRPTLTEAGLRQADAACAIERYRRVKGAIPERLEQLVPDFLAAVPADPIGGAPMRYRVDGTQYVIYSVGWDGRDAGGIVSRRSGDQQINDREGDWVWYSNAQ